MKTWFIRNVWIDASYKRFCLGFVLDPDYLALYLGPVSIGRMRKLTVQVRGY